jgi:hypothetical protein
LQSPKSVKTAEPVSIKVRLTDATVKMNTMDPIVKSNATHVPMLSARTGEHVISTMGTPSVNVYRHGPGRDAKYQKRYVKKSLMRVTILASVLTSHMILTMDINVVVSLELMDVDANAIQIIAKTNYPTERTTVTHTENVTTVSGVRI